MTLLLGPPSLIAVLLTLGCPSAVFWRVRTVIVNSIQGHIFGGAGTHISKESGKVIDPAVADGNTTTSPVGVSFVLLIKASGFHVPPNAIFGRPLHAVLGAALARALFAKATATLGFSALEATGKDDSGITAIAKALPVNMFVFDSRGALGTADNNKPSKTLTSEVFDRDTAATLDVSACKVAGTNHSVIPAITPTFPVCAPALDVGWTFDFGDNGEPVKALAGKVLKGVFAFRGMIEGHREPPVLGVTSRDVEASPAQTIGGFSSPLYHVSEQNSIQGAK